MSALSMSSSRKSKESGAKSLSGGISRLNPAHLEKKRANDRDSQRAVRAKTKAHIQHLETTVQQLQQALLDDKARTLAEKVNSQHAEIERLQGIIRTASRLLGGYAERSGMDESSKVRARISNSKLQMNPLTIHTTMLLSELLFSRTESQVQILGLPMFPKR
jgi:hypothetical protein